MEEMNFLNFETVQNYTYGLVPYSAAINMRGWSLNLGLGYYDKNGWGVEYVPNLHYDYLHHYFDFLPYHQSWAERRKNITFFVDHNFRLVKSWGEERTKHIAVGVSIFNVGKGFFL